VQEKVMSKHILVVDDSKTIRNLVTFVLKAEGFKVTMAEDGLDAIEKLTTIGSVDLILSDINMPRMDGFTFIKTIRQQDAYKDIPIIVLSTEGQEQDIQKGISLGANLYMVKPAQPEKMVRNIKMILG
jgi:two-component system chemotaxis response regulator CheY